MHRCLVANTLKRIPLRMGVIIVGAIFASARTHAMPDCGYYKLQPAAFATVVKTLVDRVDGQLTTQVDLATAAVKKQNLTQAMYQNGSLQAIPGCSHDPNGPNIEVVGGDALGINDTANAPSGFTVIVRGLPENLCQMIASLSTAQRPIHVRPEVPGRAPGNLGQCINNPVAGLMTFGRTLPMPNTAYIYQHFIAPSPAVTNAPPTTQCPIHPVDQQFYNNLGSNAVCALVKNEVGNASQKQQCTSLTASVRQQLNQLKLRYTYTDFEALGFDERLTLIRPLFQTYFTPSDPTLVADRNQAILDIFTPHPDNNIHPLYWQREINTYDKIVAGIRSVSCKNKWNSLLTSNEWVNTYPQEQQIAVLTDVASVFYSLKDIGGASLYFDRDGTLSQAYSGLNGAYTPAGATPRAGLDNTFKNTVVITLQGYTRLGVIPVTLRHALETVLEEMMHAHQYTIAGQYITGALPKDSNACDQAPMFIYAAAEGVPDGSKLNLGWVWKSQTLTAYEAHPLEVHAKKFAKYVTDSLLATNAPSCPAP